MECTVHQGVESYSHLLDIHILRRKQNPGSKQILMQLIMFTEMKRCFSFKTNLRRKFSTQVHVCKLLFLEIQKGCIKNNFRTGLLEKYKFRSSKANVNINSIVFPSYSMFFFSIEKQLANWVWDKFLFLFCFYFSSQSLTKFQVLSKTVIGCRKFKFVKI